MVSSLSSDISDCLIVDAGGAEGAVDGFCRGGCGGDEFCDCWYLSEMTITPV